MKAAVVIISYNNEAYIEETMASVNNQTFGNWVCVMVDNGSTDTTFELMQEYAENKQQFSAYKKTNEGPGAGRNLGFSKLPVDVEYVHFLDGDDILTPDYLQTKLEYMQANPEVGLLACQFDAIDNEGNYLGKGHRSRFAPNKFGWPHDIPFAVKKTPFVAFFSATGQGPYGLYRRSVFEKTGGYELASHEDTDMFCKMGLLSEVHYLPQRLYKKRVHPKNLAHNRTYRSTHHLFREKWDMYISKDKSENALIDKSLKYYYTRHKPLRDFKVALKSFQNFLKTRRIRLLKWAFACFGDGLKDLLLHNKYRKVKRERLEQLKST